MRVVAYSRPADLHDGRAAARSCDDSFAMRQRENASDTSRTAAVLPPSAGLCQPSAAKLCCQQFASHYRSQQRGLDLVLSERNIGTEFPIRGHRHLRALCHVAIGHGRLDTCATFRGVCVLVVYSYSMAAQHYRSIRSIRHRDSPDCASCIAARSPRHAVLSRLRGVSRLNRGSSLQARQERSLTTAPMWAAT